MVASCRYGFERPVHNVASLNSFEKTVRSRKSGKMLKLYNLPRGKNETRINDYNAPIIYGWGGNMDLQYIGEKSLRLNRYVTTYMSKAERNQTADLWDSIEKLQDKTIGSKLKALAMKLMKSRECGAYEAADILLGHTLFKTSVKVDYLAASMPQDRKRRVLTEKELNDLHDDSTKIYADNFMVTYYKNRPESLEPLCLYDFYSNYEYHKQNDSNIKGWLELQNNVGWVSKRRAPKIVKTPLYKPDGVQQEKYFYQLLVLLKPWRSEDELKEEDEDYALAFDRFYKSLDEEHLTKVSEFKEARDRMQDAMDKCRELMEENQRNEDDIEDVEDVEDMVEEQQENQEVSEF